MSSGSSYLGNDLENMFFDARDGYNNKGLGGAASPPTPHHYFDLASSLVLLFSDVQPTVFFFSGSLFSNSFGSFERPCCRSLSGQLRFHGRVSRKELHAASLSLAQLPVRRGSFLSWLLDNSRAKYRRGGLVVLQRVPASAESLTDSPCPWTSLLLHPRNEGTTVTKTEPVGEI